MAEIDLEKEFLDNRKRKKRAKFLGLISSTILTSFIIISYLGYAVGTRLSNATSVALVDNASETGLTELGFRVSKVIPQIDLQKYGLWLDDHNIGGDGYVYWTQPTAGSALVRYLVALTGYTSDNAVEPTTSGAFKKGDSLTIYSQPVNPSDDTPISRQDIEAPNKSYFSLDVIFRVTRKQSDELYVGVEDYGIYLDKDFQFVGEIALREALRFGFESSLVSDIVSPGRIQPGSTLVGGRLDIDGDGYYDTIDYSSLHDDDPLEYKYELAYGDFLNPLNVSNWGAATTEEIVPPGDEEDFDAQTAKTAVGVRPLVDYIPATAQYNTLSAYRLDNGDADPGQPIAVTDTRGIAEVGLKIWLEGWDRSSTDRLVGKTFGANLRFVANEVV